MAKILVALEGVGPMANSIVRLPKEFFGKDFPQKYLGIIAGSPKGIEEDKDTELSEKDWTIKKAQEMRAHAFESGLKMDLNPELFLSSQQIIDKTPFKDLMVLSYKACFNFVRGEDETADSTELFTLLKESRCPVLILPDAFEKLEHIIFCYDGRESSMIAIKVFSNLFANQFKDKEVTILTVDPEEGEGVASEKQLMRYLTHHFKNVGVRRIQGEDISQEIYDFTSQIANPLLVMGAYGRTHLSHTLVPSVARGIIFKKRLPLFIAHK